MKRNQVITVAALVIVAAVGGGILLFRGHAESFDSAAQAQQLTPPTAVQTTTPKRRDVSRLITLPGDVQPWEEATLYAKVPGYLQTILVDKGDHVQTGQLLAVIQAPELQADRDQAQQTYQSALASVEGNHAAMERAGIEQQRTQSAAEKAQADYAQAPANVAKTQAQLRQAQAALRQAQQQQKAALASQQESQAQVAKARADLQSAQADQRLADLTYERYQGIYTKNPLLIARQDVDVAESRAKAARGQTAAAQGALDAAESRAAAAAAQVDVAGSQIEQAQAQVASAQEQIDIAQAQQVSAKKQLDMAVRDVAIAGRQLNVAQATARQTQFQAEADRSLFGKQASIVDYTHIRAPFAGVVTKRYVDPGAFIQTASNSLSAASLVTLANLNPIRLYVHVPEVEARFIRVGTPVSIALTGLPDTTLTGHVARTADSLDDKTRTLLTEIDLPNRDGKILPGSYADVKVVLQTHPKVLSVPTAAVGADKTGKFVFAVENGRAKRIAVTTGFNDGAYTEITDGLHGSEQVVVTGRDALTSNAPVTASPWTPPTRR